VLNNWGYSKLSRGDDAGAERMFQRALKADPSMFTAKNNLVLARGARREYTLPILDMTQTEKAMLLHTAALSAIKQGDVATGEALLRDSIETHPQYFEAAARSLDALSQTGTPTRASSGLTARASAPSRDERETNVSAVRAVDVVETNVN
jgi:Tfp pilus assembly protein PilF